MSKKKGNGHTMTLKDFHGGSIPPDLPLPSAPGLTVKTSDRSGYERPSSRGNPIDRSDHRSLPNNSSLSWHFDDKTPFLTQTGPVGTNFDEDERKPLDGTSAPRGTINGEGIWGPPSRVELKSASGLGGNSLGPKAASGSQYHVGKRNSYSATLTEVSRVGMDSQNLKGSRAEGINFASPNVWTMRKDVASLVKSDQSAGSGSNAFSKLAHASAIDKVSSGRWQSEKVHCQMNFEISKSSEVESRSLSVNGNSTHNRIDTVDEKRYSDVMKARQAERCRNELLEHERCEISKYSEVRSRHHHTNGAQPVLNDAKLSGPELQHSLASEPRERPQLNSSRRTKPLDSEPSVADNNVQLHRQGSDSSHVETVNKPHDHANIVNPDSARTESREEERQRPKLNVKLWSQSLEKLEGNTRSDRNALFGGARPRELVLKERGVDDAAINNYCEVEEKNRAKKLSDRSVQTHYLEKTEDAHQPYARKPERSDRWVDDERKQRRNWHGDNRISMTASDRKPSPEMWQKPAEQKKSSDAVDLQCVKAASAVELVQAFSRSTSDPKVNDRLPGHRGDTGRAQQPFSRLVGPAPKPSSND
ncbi:uncharacterized protein LOC114760246 [Neltuma alba]|uniref:uncharacterized protein LOC114760246 n=1 Tax=Neltuma alba TaxID=207710 RepID=UPI0010A364EB|nr:uncharacterized protein LOC114760246 [Prosopis alba]